MSQNQMLGYDHINDEEFLEDFLETRTPLANQHRFEYEYIEHKKAEIKCSEALDDSEPVLPKSLDFEEAYRNQKRAGEYVSQFKNIKINKDDVAMVNSMSHCSADDIAKLIVNIQNSVYTLGMEEARQCRRGKLLSILRPNVSKKPLSKNGENCKK